MKRQDTIDWKQKVLPRKEDMLTTNTNDAMDTTTNEKAQPKASQAREPKDRPKKTKQKPREIQASIIGVETGTKAPFE